MWWRHVEQMQWADLRRVMIVEKTAELKMVASAGQTLLLHVAWKNSRQWNRDIWEYISHFISQGPFTLMSRPKD